MASSVIAAIAAIAVDIAIRSLVVVSARHPTHHCVARSWIDQVTTTALRHVNLDSGGSVDTALLRFNPQ